tara:strand:- start:11193 stop:13109 length:1917 start_codon:yes stop_codon:yes gene_type:complete
MTKIINKPWGKEEWLELNEKYCYKRIYINKGYKTSYQYHNFKRETNYIIKGTAEIWLENDKGVVEKKIMKAGEFFNVTPPKKHRVIALTDIILQEVSTPEVDDVIRIEDDTNRKDGKIEGEHKSPAVLLLAAGKGERLGKLTTHINKALLPINNKAIISSIINKFPSNYEIIITLGYKGNIVREYCELAHPDRNFTFVNVDDIESTKSGPGYSALKCKKYLNRPFYLAVADCIIDSELPPQDGNWLGVYPTSYPEKYSTVKSDIKGNILNFANKSNKGFKDAFIGLASILEYDIFWSELETNMQNGEIVSAFYNPSKYSNFSIKRSEWLDTGTLDDLNKTKKYFNDNPLSLHKETSEITYKEDKFIKFHPNLDNILNKSKRAEILNGLIPLDFINTNNFISYNWEKGKTLYTYNNINLYKKFLSVLDSNITKSKTWVGDQELYKSFYITKTENRKNKFIDRFGKKYYTKRYNVNGNNYDSLENILLDINLENLYNNPMYDLFHGDLQFDNIIYNEKNDSFRYIDWRESFGGSTEGGDIYYDLAKLYGGCIIPYNLAKNDNFIRYTEGISIIDYGFNVPDELSQFKNEYEKWLINKGYDLNRIKLMTAIIFLNMSPLHSKDFSKMLWFKSIEMLSDVNK